MSSWIAPELADRAAGLAPYARESLERAAALAARLHADEVSPEHWLAALLADEGCAATRVVLHAFADPETIGAEVLALCAGIMVVGSGRTLPFSLPAVEALRAARADAAAQGAARVEALDLFRAALARLAPEPRRRLGLLSEAVLEPASPPRAAVAEPVPASGPLFRHFSSTSLRALGAGCRIAGGLERDSIAPAHLVLGTLETDAELRAATGLTAGRVRMALSGLDADETPLPPRRLGGDARLVEMLASLAHGAGTLEVLGWLLARGSDEVGALLLRQKVTQALWERCRGVYEDPPAPE